MLLRAEKRFCITFSTSFALAFGFFALAVIALDLHPLITFIFLIIDYRKGVGAKAPTLGYAEGGRGGTTAPPSFGSALVPFLIDY